MKDTLARWLNYSASLVIQEPEENKVAIATDLEPLASSLNRLSQMMVDEDDNSKKELFNALWPAVESLGKADAFKLGSIARYLFEGLARLYFYLPKEDKDMIERNILEWRDADNISQDHPLRTDKSIERILRAAQQR